MQLGGKSQLFTEGIAYFAHLETDLGAFKVRITRIKKGKCGGQLVPVQWPCRLLSGVNSSRNIVSCKPASNYAIE